MRKATSESCRISLSVSCDNAARAYRAATVLRLRRDGRALEVLVRRAVVAVRERRALARLAFARRGTAAHDSSVERSGLDLLLDEGDRRGDALVHCPRDLRLAGDGEVAADVLEEGAGRVREIERILCQSLHRLLARVEDGAAVLELGILIHVRIDQVLN